MFSVEKVTDERGRVLIQDPPIARYLFQSTGLMSVVWLVVRLVFGWQWFYAGWEKLENPAWTNGSGQGILGFWKAAIVTDPKPVITFDWYRGFIQLLINSNAAGWFSYVIVFGEIAVGIGLILGAFTGVAATGGLLMNMAYLLAGTSSTNPVLALVSIFLILAWKNAGYIGLDRYLLPKLGTPWWHVAPAPAPARATAPAS